jgi:hypothetical protein
MLGMQMNKKLQQLKAPANLEVSKLSVEGREMVR